MTISLRSTRDVILRTDAFGSAVQFYSSVLGLPGTAIDEKLMRFETGAFALYVESGKPHGPIFEFLVPDVAAAKSLLLERGCVVVEEDVAVPRCYLRDPYGFTFNLGQAS